MKKFITTIAMALVTTALLSGCGGEPDQTFPSRNIEFIVPFGVGGASDIAARTIADVMGGFVDVNINIVNAPGGGTAVGMMQAYNQPADGYTVFFLTPSVPIIESQQQAPINFSEEFLPLATMQIDAVALSVHRDNPNFQTAEELIEFARANPGIVTAGGQSPGGLHDYIITGFAAAAGIELTFVPYESAGAQRAAFLGREIDIYLENVSALTPLLNQPEIVPFIHFHEYRITAIPEIAHVPTALEIGVDFIQGSWRAMAVRRDTPQEIIDYLENLLHQVYLSDEYQYRAELENSNYISGWRTAAQTADIWAYELSNFISIFGN